jgi:hypothetical protein
MKRLFSIVLVTTYANTNKLSYKMSQRPAAGRRYLILQNKNPD